MSRDIWRIHNTRDVLVLAGALVGARLRTVTRLVTTGTTLILGRDGLDRGGDVVECWFSFLRSSHPRPTIYYHIAEEG